MRITTKEIDIVNYYCCLNIWFIKLSLSCHDIGLHLLASVILVHHTYSQE